MKESIKLGKATCSSQSFGVSSGNTISTALFPYADLLQTQIVSKYLDFVVRHRVY